MKHTLTLFTAQLLVPLAALHAADEPAIRPNILLIVSEDNGPELGCYGDPYPDYSFGKEPAKNSRPLEKKRKTSK
jgi:hypothetical protein